MQMREQVFIGGKWHNAGDNATIDVLNPATGAAIDVAFGGIKDSGIGNEGSKYGLEDYLNIKYSLIG
jgi:acyl-CoA reductase-like NAD-dependent aldehyde dehydrogenase